MDTSPIQSQNILTDKYIKVDIESSIHLLIARWSKESEFMSEDEFKNVNLLYVSAFEANALKYMLINAKFFLFPIYPELQEWVNQEVITKLIGNGLQKVAFVISEELIPQLSIEQTMENTSFSQYFSTEEAAKKWLSNLA